MGNAAKLLNETKEIARKAKTCADLSNALYNPQTGILARAYRDRDQRRRFMQTRVYKEIQKIALAAIDKSGSVEGAAPVPRRKVAMRVPKTLHGALIQEANNEGLSLNQLILFKLASSRGER